MEPVSRPGIQNVSQLPPLDISFSRAPSEGYRKYGLPIYLAALNGDWESVKGTLKQFPDAVRVRITQKGETALHVAAAAKHTAFVTELVKWMRVDDLALLNDEGNTALFFAAASGKVQVAKVLVGIFERLPMIRGTSGTLPLYMAAMLGHGEMVRYLYGVTIKSELTPLDRINLLTSTIDKGIYDIALDILQKDPDLATARSKWNETALYVLARKPLKLSIFATQTSRQLGWRRCTKFFSGSNQFQEKTAMNPTAIQILKCLWEGMVLSNNTDIISLIETQWPVLSVATRLGNVDFIVTLFRLYPDLIWIHDEKGHGIFHVAVMHRQENIFRLIYGIGGFKDLIAVWHDRTGNNMLHLAGMLAPPDRLNLVSGAALQMQRELLWFKEVEKVVQPQLALRTNRDGETPRDLFTKSHQGLREAGEKWMKETANSCMVVAALIATMTFAAAFTLPGGNTDTGIPIYRKTIPFTVFAISDAIALLCSSISILTFLSILTSRYAEEDFLESLPIKLIIGLAMLVISVAAMMGAFCSSFFIVFYNGVKWISVSVAVIASLPVLLFGLLQYSLFYDVMYSTYSSRSLFIKSKHAMF